MTEPSAEGQAAETDGRTGAGRDRDAVGEHELLVDVLVVGPGPDPDGLGRGVVEDVVEAGDVGDDPGRVRVAGERMASAAGGDRPAGRPGETRSRRRCRPMTRRRRSRGARSDEPGVEQLPGRGVGLSAPAARASPSGGGRGRRWRSPVPIASSGPAPPRRAWRRRRGRAARVWCEGPHPQASGRSAGRRVAAPRPSALTSLRPDERRGGGGGDARRGEKGPRGRRDRLRDVGLRDDRAPAGWHLGRRAGGQRARGELARRGRGPPAGSRGGRAQPGRRPRGERRRGDPDAPGQDLSPAGAGRRLPDDGQSDRAGHPARLPRQAGPQRLASDLRPGRGRTGRPGGSRRRTRSCSTTPTA